MSFTTSHLKRVVLLFFLIFMATTINACKEVASDPSVFGPWSVGHMVFDAVDENREDRTLRVDVWYPVDAEDSVEGPLTIYPLDESGSFGLAAEIAVDNLPVSSRPLRKLVVFSHGYGGTNTQSTPLMETLASHGFIVASPEHTGNTATDSSDTHEEAAAKRVPDISFIIDYMAARSADPDDPFFRRIHHSQVGVVGHSFGGATALGMAAGFAGGEPDKRVRAIVPISAVVENAFSEEELKSVKVPTLLMGGTEDTSVPIENNDLAFELIPGCRPVYQVDIVGANHTHFANVCAIGDFLIEFGLAIDFWQHIGAGALVQPYMDTCTEGAFPIEEAIAIQNLYTVSFFKRHLQYNWAYGYYLTEYYANQNEPDVVFSVKRAGGFMQITK